MIAEARTLTFNAKSSFYLFKFRSILGIIPDGWYPENRLSSELGNSSSDNHDT